jgi:hypothetical protein
VLFRLCRVVAYQGGGVQPSPPLPRNSEVLTKSNRIANGAEHVECSYATLLMSLKIAEFRTPTPQDVRKKAVKF